MRSRIFRDDMLEGQVCLVTGGGTGIGAAISRELGLLGATVVIASRTEDKLSRAAAGLSEQIGRPVHYQVCNIRDRQSITDCVAAVIEQHGRLDALVNNAGGQFFSPAEDIRPKGWDAVIETNLTGTWDMTRAVFDQWMGEHGGRIVHITMSTKRTFTGMAHSVAARAGVEAFTRTAAIEWAHRDIRMNAIAPGLIASSGLLRYPAGLGVMNEMEKHIPLKRAGRPEDIAWMVAYLVGPAGDYITGQTLTVDGGKELWGDWWPIADPQDVKPMDIRPEPWEVD